MSQTLVENNQERVELASLFCDVWSPDGQWFTQQQADGNLVKYHTATPFQKIPDQPGQLIG